MTALGVETIIYTDIAADGMLEGPSFERLAALRAALPETTLVASGGIANITDIITLRKMGIDAAIAGKALYTGDLDLTDALREARFKRPLTPAVIQHADTGEVLMLGYMSPESLRMTMENKLATFYSRSRGEIWVKGATSGNYLDVVSIHSDCDNDALLVRCRPRGPTCHTGAESCFFKEVMV
jgi:phosphoribosyl-AMP cyclohydrolase